MVVLHESGASVRQPGSRRLRSGVAGAVLLFLASSVASASAQTLVFGNGGPDSVFSNLTSRVVAEAARRAGIAVEFRVVPLARGAQMTSDGELDGDVARTADITQRYPNMVIVPTPVAMTELAVYGASPDLPRRTRDEIRRMRACVLRGSVIAIHHTQGMRVELVPTRDSALLMAAAGRCDVFVSIDLGADAAISSLGITNLVRWPQTWASEPLYLTLNRRRSEFIEPIDRALRQMAQEGLIERYLRDERRAQSLAAPRVPAGPDVTRR